MKERKKFKKAPKRQLHRCKIDELRRQQNLKTLNGKPKLLHFLKNVNEITANFFWSQQRNQK
jgi:hypothetical protein